MPRQVSQREQEPAVSRCYHGSTIYSSGAARHSARYLLPRVYELLPRFENGGRMLDVGCGNGYIAGQLLARGWDVVGVDLSQSGIEQARRAYPSARFELCAADAHMLERLDEPPFDLVVSTEVVEHLYDPRSFVYGCYAATKPGGRVIISAPYHGYAKNLALAVADRFDSHLDPLWTGGHIKFWSRKSLSRLLTLAGFEKVQFRGAGRLPYFWMSMVMAADRPRPGPP